ncbi:unnamed protein product [Closterium sp. Naga37s-1]|nr:unnamed protein product [Closterium sp. Naga37s-1]CAI5965725.1 unnamed protein product [Closterium sp. NIES-65]
MTEYVVRGSKDLKSIKDLKGLQDGPPPGGFPAVRYGRRIMNTGPSGAALVLVSTAVIAFGFYQIGQGNIKRRAEKKEKIDARVAILPLIQAEEDARFAAARREELQQEAHIMRNVDGWVVGQSVYNSGRWMRPANGKLAAEY